MVDGERGTRGEYKSASEIIVDCNGERRCEMGLAYFAVWHGIAVLSIRGAWMGGAGWDWMKQRVFFLAVVCNLVAHLRSLLLNPFLPLRPSQPAIVPYILDSH
jgi:hypothetical protein